MINPLDMFSVDTVQVRPFSEALTRGELLLPQDTAGIDVVPGILGWSDSMLNCSLIAFSTIVAILLIDRLPALAGNLLGGLLRAKELLNIEDSVRLSRDRNYLAAACVMPFCMVVSRYGLFLPDAVAELSPGMRTAAVCAAFASIVLSRAILILMLRPRSGGESYWASGRCLYDMFIICTLVMMVTVGIFLLTRPGENAARLTLYIEIGLFFFIFMLRRREILAHSFNLFPTILYLCTLEILPAAMAVAPQFIF